MGSAAAYVTEAWTYMSCNRVKAIGEIIEMALNLPFAE